MLQSYINSDGVLSEVTEGGNVKLYVSPDRNELASLIGERHFDRHNLESAMDPDELGRVEADDKHIFMVLKRPLNYSSKDNFLFRITSSGIFIDDKGITLILSEKIDITDLGNARKYPDINGLMLRFLLNATNHFLSHLKVMSMVLQSIEEKIAENLTGAKIDSEKLLNIYSLEKSLIYYSNGISSNQIVLEKIRALSERLGFSLDHRDFLDDIIIENDQCRKLTETLTKIVEALNRTRETIVNNKLNTVMKRLTVITTVFMPLSVITGFFGMSEFTMIAGGSGWWFISYPLFIVILIIIALLTYRNFKKRGWT